jgi:hypothetical protein
MEKLKIGPAKLRNFQTIAYRIMELIYRTIRERTDKNDRLPRAERNEFGGKRLNVKKAAKNLPVQGVRISSVRCGQFCV